jgi:hypothetical protein
MSRATDLLKQCIDGKWTLLVEEPEAEEPDCKLCDEYLENSAGYTCSGCPVAGETGETRCDGTPYDAWLDEREGWENESVIRAAAQAEKDWLRALYEKLMKEEAT